ncbi:MAG: hypothetical protein ABWY22_09160 [Flavobacterium sp.]
MKLKLLCAKPDKIILVIKNPEITKNTSTPLNPPEKNGILKWNSKTLSTETALKKPISNLYFIQNTFIYYLIKLIYPLLCDYH